MRQLNEVRRRRNGIRRGLIISASVVTTLFTSPGAFASATSHIKPIGPSVVLKFEDDDATTDPATIWANNLASEMAKQSGGAVQIQVYPNSELVSQAGAGTAVETNSIQMGYINLSTLAASAPQLTGIDLEDDPFFEPTLKQADAVMQSVQMKNLINSATSSVNLRLIGGCVQSPAYIISTVPYATISSFSGVKMRVANTANAAMVAPWGAFPTVISLGSVYQAFLLHTFTAALSSSANDFENSWYQVAKYVDEIPTEWSSQVLFINNTAFSSMNAAERKLLLADSVKSGAACDTSEKKFQLTIVHALQTNGTTFVVPKSTKPFIASEASVRAAEIAASPLAEKVNKLIVAIDKANS